VSNAQISTPLVSGTECFFTASVTLSQSNVHCRRCAARSKEQDSQPSFIHRSRGYVMSSVTINTEQHLFVLRERGGCSCLGFEVVRDRTRQYAALLGESLPDPLPYATLDALRLYENIEMRLARSPIARHLTIYDPNTPEQLVTILERVRLRRIRIRLFYGDAQTGRDWNEENDVEGYLARTSGPIHCPILLKTKSSTGGHHSLGEYCETGHDGRETDAVAASRILHAQLHDFRDAPQQPV
jgi:hypothetical protein